MVKIGKRLKGFDKGTDKIENDHGETLINKNKIDIKNNKKESIEEKEQILYFKNENVKKKKEYDDIDLYVKNNNISIFLVLLLYKTIITKPPNVCSFILSEIDMLLKCKINKSKEYNLINNQWDTDQKNNEEKEDRLKKNYSIKLIDYKVFLDQNYLSLDNVLDAINFIKMENSDNVYFNNFLKIIQVFENSKNKEILLNEHMQPTDTIPLNKALNLANIFYNNYFYNDAIRFDVDTV